MDWFNDIPKIFTSILLIIGLIIFFGVYMSIDFRDSTKFLENMNKLTGAIVDFLYPTEVQWISWIMSVTSNSWVLLVTVIFIFWLFGYFSSKGTSKNSRAYVT